MPRMSGIEFLRQLRTVDPDVPFLMVTGKADRTAVLEARNCGVTAYIRKPFLPLELETKLRIMTKGGQRRAMAAL